MSRKESVTHTYLREKAFEMTRTKGISEVTARKLAAFAGCSTQPIFRNYENMAACYDEVFEDSLSFFDGTREVTFLLLIWGFATYSLRKKNPISFPIFL